MLKLVIGQGMTLTLIGVAIGLAAALALTPLLETLVVRHQRDRLGDLHGDRGAVGLGRATGLLSSGTAQVDPLIALRQE